MTFLLVYHWKYAYEENYKKDNVFIYLRKFYLFICNHF